VNHLDWVKDTSQFRDVQERIESDCQSLIDAYFHDGDNYAIEKFLKTYTEGFKYLEKLLLLQNKIHADNAFDEPRLDHSEISKRMKQVNATMMNEAKRQFRHALAFMGSIKSHSPALVAERRNFGLLENAIDKVLDGEAAAKVFACYHEQRKIAESE